MSGRAPLPNPFSKHQLDSLPIAPPLKLSNLLPLYFFIHYRCQSHGKNWLIQCLKSDLNLLQASYASLPRTDIIFYWIQREYTTQIISNYIHTPSKLMPIISHIPSQFLITHKVELGRSLFTYYNKNAWKYIPITYDASFDKSQQKWNIDHIRDVIESQSKDYIWIVKADMGSLGSEVFLFKGNTLHSLQIFLQSKYNFDEIQSGRLLTVFCTFQSIIIQEYIHRPLLYKQRFKFDLRCYVMVATTNPTVCFYHTGKMRMCAGEYNINDISDMNLFSHITNCAVQRSHTEYEHKSSSINGQSMLNDWKAFLEYIWNYAVVHRHSNGCRFSDDWYEQYLENIDNITIAEMSDLMDQKCRRLCSAVYDSVAQYFDEDSVHFQRPCQFSFHGVDIMFDEDGELYMLEINRCASISLIGYESIREMTKVMLREMLMIQNEIRELKLKGIIVDENTHLKSVHTWQKMEMHYKNGGIGDLNNVNRNNMEYDDYICEYKSLNSSLLLKVLDQLIIKLSN